MKNVKQNGLYGETFNDWKLLGAKQIIATHTVQLGGISADLLERILTAPRLTATQFSATYLVLTN